MWVLDFGLGDFAHVGMAGIFWLNRQDYGYFGHEIYLLPGQMIPEHCHLATDKGPAKMESWQPRHGMIYTFGEGQPTPELFAQDPGQPARAGQVAALQAAGDRRGRRPESPRGLAFHGGRPGRGPGDRIRHLPRHGRPAVLEPQGQSLRAAGRTRARRPSVGSRRSRRPRRTGRKHWRSGAAPAPRPPGRRARPAPATCRPAGQPGGGARQGAERGQQTGQGRPADAAEGQDQVAGGGAPVPLDRQRADAKHRHENHAHQPIMAAIEIVGQDEGHRKEQGR